MELSILLRVRKRGRYPYLIGSSLVSLGYRVLVYEKEIVKQSSKREYSFYEKIFKLNDIGIIEDIHKIDHSNLIFIDMVRDGNYLNLNWNKIMYYDTRESPTEPVLFDEVDRYLRFGNCTNHQDKRICTSPYWPHPELNDTNDHLKNISHKNRILSMIAFFTPKPTNRKKILNIIEKRSVDILNFIQVKDSIRKQDIQKYLYNGCLLFSDNKPVSYEEWFYFLSQSRWCLDIPGYGLMTHRTMEACLNGSALVIHEKSASSYNPPLRDGIECLTYNEKSMVEIINKAIQTPFAKSQKIAENAIKYYSRFQGDKGLAKCLNF